jgi:phage major head subunit gpT-like protein
MANIFTNGKYRIITAALRAEFQKGIEETTLVGTPLFQKVASNGYENVYSWLEHVPGMKKWVKGDVRTVRNYGLRDFSIPNVKYEDTIDVDIDDVEDNQLGQLGPMMRQQVDAAKLLVDELIFGQLNNGFASGDNGSDGSALTYDGNPWFYASHPVGVGTINNLMTAQLSPTSFATAYQQLKAFKVQPDKLSKPRPLNPGGQYLLVCHPFSEVMAREILVAERNANGSSNVLMGTADILSTSWLTNTNSWYLLNMGASIKPIFLQERDPLTMLEKTPANSDSSFYYDKLTYGLKWRGAALPTFPWLAIGSDGSTSF